jgi:hypothetical protein
VQLCRFYPYKNQTLPPLSPSVTRHRQQSAPNTMPSAPINKAKVPHILTRYLC